MEDERPIGKEKKISVKICKGNIWEELRENLTDKRCLDEKKSDRKRLVVDINVRREFRSPPKDDSWVNRIKSALTRGRFQDLTSSDKKDSAAKQKKEPSKGKPGDKKKEAKETEKVLDADLLKEESKNIVSQTKKRLKDKDQSTSGVKTKKSSREEELKDKSKNNVFKTSMAGGDSICETERAPEAGLKRSRGNKYEVQINNNVVVMNPNDSEEDPAEAEERLKRRQFTKDKRSKSKPATVKEKWNESVQAKALEKSYEPTLETIKSLKPSIISLRVVDKNKIKVMEAPKDKCKDSNDLKKEEEKRKKRKSDEDYTKETCFRDDCLEKETTRADLRDVENDKSKFKEDKILDVELCKVKPEGARRKDKRIKISSDSSSEDSAAVSSSSTVKVKLVALPQDLRREDIKVSRVGFNEILLEDRGPVYSSSCYSGSTSSEEQECSCGCMESRSSTVSRQRSESSQSSTSSLEYLRSYSGNLIMCAHGKKPVLNEHIRYLSSCFKL